MRVHIAFIKNVFKENLAYRANYYTQLIGATIAVLIQIYLWRALLGSSGQTATDMGVVTLDDMTTYVLLSAMIAALMQWDYVVFYVDGRIQTGLMAMDLIRPMNFQIHVFARMMGNNLFSFLFRLLPVMVFGIVFFNLQRPTPEAIFLFPVVILLGVVISFQMAYMIGMIGFWYMRSWQFSFLLNSLFRLFSGALIPIWFFPGVLADIAEFLPFRLVFFAPISIYLGTVDLSGGLYIILQQVIWIGGLLALTKVVWSRGTRKLVLQGG